MNVVINFQSDEIPSNPGFTLGRVGLSHFTDDASSNQEFHIDDRVASDSGAHTAAFHGVNIISNIDGTSASTNLIDAEGFQWVLGKRAKKDFSVSKKYHGGRYYGKSLRGDWDFDYVDESSYRLYLNLI